MASRRALVRLFSSVAACAVAALISVASPAVAAAPAAPAAPATLASAGPDRALRFVAAGQPERILPLDALRASCGAERVRVDDPYYHREMEFLACPLAWVLEQGFGVGAPSLSKASFLLRALDGYTKPASGEALLGEGGWLAFADASLSDVDAEPFEPRFEPIDRRQVDPSPFYLVWTGVEAEAAHEKPWPYQLATIEMTSLERAFERAAPSGLAREARAWRGFERFVSECIACHSVNGQGGRVGPELNVPRSIVEYRDAVQLKAFIRAPESFRYTSMPAHAHLDERDLDDLLDYFRAMSERKRDPNRAAKDGADGEHGGHE